jgi:hypothetical protein
MNRKLFAICMIALAFMVTAATCEKAPPGGPPPGAGRVPMGSW